MSTALPDKLDQLKKIIHEHLQTQNIYEQIRQFLSSYTQDKTMGILTEEKIIKALQEKGVIDDIVKSIQSTPSPPPSPPPNPLLHAAPIVAPPVHPTLVTGKRYLYLKVLGGRAFVEYLSGVDQGEGTTSGGHLELHFHMMNQRVQCKQVPCSVEPQLTDSFFFELQGPHQTGKPLDATAMLQMTANINLVLVKVLPDATTSLIASHSLEWRKVLKTGSLAISIELARIGNGPKIPIGILDFRLEIVPKLERTIPEIEISAQLKAERAHRSEALQLFFVSAKTWWNDYVQICKAHNQRLVKVFAQNEQGVDLPVCTYVQSMRVARLLDSPRHAARFVSLLPVEKDELLGGGSKDVWHSIHTFLCKRKGSAEDHSILLCSLLLGFGLDAYVCMGADDKGGHAWVLTYNADGRVVFWESLTGVRYEHNAPSHPSRSYKYQTIECIFNDKHLYANIQADESIARTVFDFGDRALWKQLTLEAVSIIKPQPLPPLLPPSLDVPVVEGELEQLLKNLIAEHRKGLGLTTIFDDSLAYLLRPALWAYEQERFTQTSQGLGNDEFQQSIKRAVPEGHTFKGFPIQFSHRSPSRMMLAFLRAKACVDILATRADQVRFALQIKIFAYPENVCAVWAMVACKYIDLY